jgi:hypothetical protein
MDDPIVEEVRKTRQEHAKKFNYNVDEIFKDFKLKEIQSNFKTVSRPPKLFLRKSA